MTSRNRDWLPGIVCAVTWGVAMTFLVVAWFVCFAAMFLWPV